MNTKAKITIEAEDKTHSAVASAQRGLAALQNSSEKLTSLFSAGVGGAFAGSLLAVAAATRSGINELDRLEETAPKIGVTAQQLANLSYNARMAGSSNEALEKGITTLSQKMAEGSKVFETMGVKIRGSNGELRGTEDVLLDLADKFSQYKDGPGKVALANEVMGKSGRDLIGVLNQGSEGIRKMNAEAKALGLVFNSETSQAAGQYKDNLDRLGTSVQGVGIALATRMLPHLNAITNAMVEGIKQGGLLRGVYQGLQTALTGDDLYKNNVALTEDTEKLFNLQRAMERMQSEGAARGESAEVIKTTLAYKGLQKQLDEVNARLKTTMAYRKELNTQAAAPAPDKPPPPPPGAGAGTTAKSLYDQLTEELAKRNQLVTAELDNGAKLSEGRKFELDILAKLAAGYDKLTLAQVVELEAKANAIAGQMDAIDLRKSEFEQAMDIAKARQKLRDDEYKAGQETVRQALEDSTARNRIARETLENIQFETSLLGLNTREREQAVAMRELERQGIRQGTEAWDLYAQAIQQAVASRSGIQQGIDDFGRLWAELDSTGRDTFRSIGDSWKGTVQRMKDTAKNTLFDYLYQVAARPILFKLAAQFSGAPANAVQSVAGQVFGGGGNNILTNLISGADIFNKGGIAGLGSLFGGGGATVSTAAQLGAGLEGFLGGSGVFASAGGTSAGLLGAAGTALPWVGGALLLGSMFDKKRGGPKTIGGAEEAGNIQAGIQSMLAQFGASTTGLRVGGFSAADPQGTSLTQLQTALFSGDRALYSRQDRVGDYENVGRSQEELAAAWAEETARITLAALQARLGPQYQQYLEGLDANISSVDDINAGLTRVNQARALEARLLELTSTEEQKLAEARRQERATFGPTLQGLLDRIYAEQDLQREAAATTSVLDRRAEALAYATSIEDAALSALGRAIEKERTALQAQRDAAAERVAEISGVFSTVSEAVRDLWAQTAATTAMAAREGNSLIAGALATAKTTGYLPSQASLAEAIGAVRGGIAATPYASERERAFDQLVLAGQLNQLKTISGSQLTEAERSLDVAEEQLSQLQRTYDTAREQLEATRTGTLTIAQALAGVQAALQGAAAVRGAAPGGRPATPLTDAEIAAWVVPRAGVSEAANMALYNDALANRDRGVTLAKIDEAAGLPAGTSAAWAIANGKQLFATGAAFTNGVVTRPTAFDIGVMGEGQDPEGILPLTNVGGRLGVDARTNNAEIVAALRTNSTAIESLGKRLDGIQAATERTAAALSGQQKFPLLVEVVTEE